MENKDFINEFIFQTSRSGGAGGQNVNKVSTKVELRFHVDNSLLLSEEEKVLIKQKFANKITQEGFLQIISQTERTQLRNKQNAIEKFYLLISSAAKKNKIRTPSAPTRAGQRKRLDQKKKEGVKKSFRSWKEDVE